MGAKQQPAAIMSSPVFSFKDFSVRPWCPRDRSAAAEIVRTCKEVYGFHFEPEGKDKDIVYVEECYQDGELWVVEGELGKIMGICGYCKVGEEAVEIKKMYLLSEARGKGLGRFLLRVSGK